MEATNSKTAALKVFNQLADVVQTNAWSYYKNSNHRIDWKVELSENSIVIQDGLKAQIKITISDFEDIISSTIEHPECDIQITFSNITSIIPHVYSSFSESYTLVIDEESQPFWKAADGYYFYPITLVKKIFAWLLETRDGPD